MRSGEPAFWLNPVFEDGQPIDELLIRAAQDFWPEAVCATKKALNDGTRAGEILEQSVHEVGAKRLDNQIQNPLKLSSYLRVAFYRLLHRVSTREGCVYFYAPDALHLDEDVNTTQSAPIPSGSADPNEQASNWARRTYKASTIWSSPNTQSRPGPAYIDTVIDLDRLLAQLTEEERTILRLFWLEDEDWHYIAKKVGMTQGNARVMSYRALRKLRRLASQQRPQGAQCQQTTVSFPKKKRSSREGSGVS